MVRSVSCRVCKLEKSIDQFWKDKTRSKTGYQSVCKQCYRVYRQRNKPKHNKRVREWYGRNKHKIRDQRIVSIYGITRVQFFAMIKEQGNKCLICYSLFSIHKKPVIDHNHSTGGVRGILCNGCNYGLGIFQDNIARLNQAIQYLQNEGKVSQ
jgi:hypothetical protein